MNVHVFPLSSSLLSDSNRSSNEIIMSTQRFSESRSYHEESRRNVGNNSNPRITSTTLPVLNTSIDFPRDIGEQRVQERLRHQDTSVRWLNDPSTGQEKFRVTINIEGFQQHEVREISRKINRDQQAVLN